MYVPRRPHLKKSFLEKREKRSNRRGERKKKIRVTKKLIKVNKIFHGGVKGEKKRMGGVRK